MNTHFLNAQAHGAQLYQLCRASSESEVFRWFRYQAILLPQDFHRRRQCTVRWNRTIRKTVFKD